MFTREIIEKDLESIKDLTDTIQEKTLEKIDIGDEVILDYDLKEFQDLAIVYCDEEKISTRSVSTVKSS